MLNINPKMLPRLDELEADLLARRERAIAEGWDGELEGIDLALAFLRDKQKDAKRLNSTTPILFGLPTVRQGPGP